MLTIYDTDARSTRRQILSVGGLTLGGLSLSTLLAAESTGKARAASPGVLTGKSVIFLFQQGGPSQFETFDPKIDAPSGIRTFTGTQHIDSGIRPEACANRGNRAQKEAG